jgi:hypothetical protein
MPHLAYFAALSIEAAARSNAALWNAAATRLFVGETSVARGG